MRIASVYLPSFPLQVHVRRMPHLAGAAFAVTTPAPHPIVVACSRTAWDLGVRAGMSAVKVHAIAPGTELVSGDPALHRRAADALAEVLLTVASRVEVPPPLSSGPLSESGGQTILVQVPAGVRGASFGQTVLNLVSRHGYRARAGIADDRFAAEVASFVGTKNGDTDPTGQRPFDQCCVVVPRGGAAAYLAPLPLSLLPVEEEMRHALEALGVRTIGNFADLPRPSIVRRRAAVIAPRDLHALAAGDGCADLTEFMPAAQVVESVELEHACDGIEPVGFLLRPLLDRICARVAGRGAGVAAMAIRLHGAADATDSGPAELFAPFRETRLRPDAPTLSSRDLLDATREELARRPLDFAVTGVDLIVLEEAEVAAEDPEEVTQPPSISEFRLTPVLSRGRADYRRTRRGKNRRRHRRPDHQRSQGTD